MRAREVCDALNVAQREELVREELVDARHCLGPVVRADPFFDVRAQRLSDPGVVANEDTDDAQPLLRGVDVGRLEAVCQKLLLRRGIERCRAPAVALRRFDREARTFVG